MPQYKPHPKEKDTTSRMNRKRGRKEAFSYNKYQVKKDLKKRREEEKKERAKLAIDGMVNTLADK